MKNKKKEYQDCDELGHRKFSHSIKEWEKFQAEEMEKMWKGKL